VHGPSAAPPNFDRRICLGDNSKVYLPFRPYSTVPLLSKLLKMAFVPYVFTPPTHGASPSPPMRSIGGYAYLSHTSRAGWKSQKNIIFSCETTTESGTARSAKDQKLSVSYESSEGGSKTIEELTGWEFVGGGRYGPLESWMVETDFGIEDTSGKTIMLFL